MAASVKTEQFLDPRWRLSNLYFIVNKQGQRVLFQPNDAQLEYLDSASNSDIILKARQKGFTTLMCLIALDEAIWLENHAAAIIAHKLDDANVIFETKVKYPYDNLPESIKAGKPAKNDRAGLLSFNHGSSIRVATSARSGTLQRLHVSEFGKICAQYPQKAREIVTGAFPAVGQNPKTIESTAEGQDGYFFQFCQEAQRGDGQFKFHFSPWYTDPGYVYSPDLVTITAQDEEYFQTLKLEHGIDLTPAQKAWYVREEQLLGGDMKRENPSHPDEAFEQAIEGAYFARQLEHAQKRGSIGTFPHVPGYPVNTFWDLGRNDFTTVWFHQHVKGRDRFIHYYESSGEHISHYFGYLKEWAKRKDAQLGDVYWPHDGKREDLFLEDGRLGVAEDLGFSPEIVARASNKLEAIEIARARFVDCDFDETDCALGVKRLRHFRKEWDDMREVFRDRPRHDDNSHGADGFMTYSSGWRPSAPQQQRRRQRRTGWAA